MLLVIPGELQKQNPILLKESLLNVEKIKTTPHLTPECRNVIIESAISSLDMYIDQIENKDEVISFVERQLNNSRRTAKLKAEKFLKKNR
jgi:hypothetical protein